MSRSPKQTILIVDDTEENILILTRILNNSGFNVVSVRSGEAALELLKKDIPDIILLDIVMPGMDGIDTCKRLKDREETSEIPVIFITSVSDTPEKIKAFNAGGVDYIDRPFVREEVLARINVHVRLNETMDKLRRLSVTDELTGAYNRRFAYQMIERQIKLCRREREGFVVCYLDIDNLKEVNDHYGHETGDKLIKATVETLESLIRKSDMLFRMGGDEFLVLFPRARLKESNNLMERIRNGLKSRKINNASIEFSFGFSECTSDREMTVEKLIKEADARMYEEKSKKKG